MNKAILITIKVVITIIVLVITVIAKESKMPMAIVVGSGVIIAIWAYKPSKKDTGLDNQKLDKK